MKAQSQSQDGAQPYDGSRVDPNATARTAARASQYQGYPQQPSGKRQLEEIIDLLYRRRWVILGTFLLIAGGTVFLTMRQVPQYSTNSIVMVDLGTTQPTTATVSVPSGENSLFANNMRTLAGELFIIQNSYAIAHRVEERLNELAEPNALGHRPAGHVKFDPASRDVSAIMITATSAEPRDAALLANVYAEEYIRLTQEANRSYMTSSRAYLEEQERNRREELQSAEERVTRHLSSGQGLGLDPTGSAVVAQLSTLESQRDAAMIDLQMKVSSLQVIEKELNEISPQLAKRMASGLDSRLAQARDRLNLLQAQKKEILLYYPNATEAELASHPDLPKINNGIDKLEDEIRNLSEQFSQEVMAAGGVVDGTAGLPYVNDLRRQAVQAEIEIDGLKAQIEVLNRHISRNERELSTIPTQSLELARLEREKQHAEQMYSFVVQRLQETRIAEESEPGYAHILREANEPVQPVHPDKPRNIILGLFFGIMFGLGLAVVRDKLDNRLYKPDDLTARGYKVIGIVPDMKALIKEDHNGATHVEHNGRRYATSLITLVNPLSAISETYRQLRARIQFSRPDIVVQTILVTSSSPGEGKSVTASNIAITMAQAGRRTLLIDADLRRPKLHEMWGVDPDLGLVQLLFSQPGTEIQNFRTDVDNLFVVPAGSFSSVSDGRTGQGSLKEGGNTVVSNPAELLGSKRMRELLRSLRSQFDVIVIDTPPVLAASDAILLSTQADASIVVVRAGKTKEGEIDAVAEELDNVGSPVVGVLLNGFDVSMAYGRKYRYQHYSKYGPYGKYGYYSTPNA